MNLILRMFIVWLGSLFRPRLPLGRLRNELRLRVLPNDLDLNMHMNDGRYITLCDLSRIDAFLRTGLAGVMLRKGWMPVIAEHTMRYRKSLKPFQRFTLVMELTHWDDRGFYMKHTFLIGERVAAEGESVGMIRGRHGVIPPDEVIEAVRQAREH